MDHLIDDDDGSVRSSYTFEDDVESSINPDRLHPDESAEEDPEFALVRKVTRAVRASRAVVLLVMVLAAGLTAWMVHKYTADSELDAFEQEFDGVAQKILQSLKGESISLKFWMARTLADAIHLSMKLTGSNAINVTMPTTEWDSLTGELRVQANAHVVSYSPVLRTEQDRNEFIEAFRNAKGKNDAAAGTNPPCWPCEEPSAGYSNPDDEVNVPGFGTFKCSRIETLGRTGIVPESMCQFAKEQANTVCECTPNIYGISSDPKDNDETSIDYIFSLNANGTASYDTSDPPLLPIRYVELLSGYRKPTLYNQLQDPIRKRALDNVLVNGLPVLSETFISDGPYASNFTGFEGEPGAMVYFPVFSENEEIVGAIGAEFAWRNFMTGIFPSMAEHVVVVVENSCGQNYTYGIDPSSNRLVVSGGGDLHDRAFSHMAHSSTYEDFEATVKYAASRTPDYNKEMEYCRYKYHIFPRQTFQDEHVTAAPIWYASIAAAIFLFTSIVFLVYDMIVDYRQRAVMATARKTHDIVSSLFPKTVRNRLMSSDQHPSRGKLHKSSSMNSVVRGSKQRLVGFVTGSLPAEYEEGNESEPIAELFPHASVAFIDIVGFTPWSSERDPAQVFILLEAIYRGFDEIAKKLGIFKVETIGDSYLAVAGLPTPRSDHAVAMTRFARHCLDFMSRRTKELEIVLGPSTGDLTARVGLHSGAVTAGVLRGEKGRFQLFGDTVNMASRLEGSGMPQKIHASAATADELRKAGKEHWVTARDEPIAIKGKGEICSFWLYPSKRRDSSLGDEGMFNSDHTINFDQDSAIEKNYRLVKWTTDTLCPLLARVVAQREEIKISDKKTKRAKPLNMKEIEFQSCKRSDEKIVLDELTEILPMPDFNKGQKLPDASALPGILASQVQEQIREFVLRISALYRHHVPFHNFEHASHVTMSAGKLMKRILNPEGVQFDKDNVEEQIHSMTYGMSSDPLMQFAVVFACLIHDVDHTGLPNATLIAKKDLKATYYRNQSVAEQNSVDVAWTVLMEDEFAELRACIYTNEQELARFRTLVVNAVLATDIADKKMAALRKNRWNDAFAAENENKESPVEINVACTDGYRKATIVFEHIIQAADYYITQEGSGYSNLPYVLIEVHRP